VAKAKMILKKFYRIFEKLVAIDHKILYRQGYFKA